MTKLLHDILKSSVVVVAQHPPLWGTLHHIMLLNMLFDDDEDGYISALFQVGDHVLQLKQKPHEGRVYDKDKEDLQEKAMADPKASQQLSSSNGDYDSAFPNVGLVVWQAGFVLAEYLLRTQPLGPWSQGLRVLELGCGTGQLGIALAIAGAAVTLTDLGHIVELTQTNVDLNASQCTVRPVCAPYMWGTPAHHIPLPAQAVKTCAACADTHKLQRAAATTAVSCDGSETPHEQRQEHVLTEQQLPLESPQQQREQQQEQQASPWDVIVAADVLYEPQYYDALLESLMQLCPASSQQQHVVSDGSTGSPSSDRARQQSCQQPVSQMPSPPIYMCYRRRVYGEHGFEERAEACGFKVTAVQPEELHPDYQCGGYRLVLMQRL